MKKYLVSIFLLTNIFFSCTGDISDSNNGGDLNVKLLGNWEWVESKGGITGSMVITPNSFGKTVF